MFKDKIMIAGMAGFLGILADEFIEWLAFLFKIVDSVTIHMIGNIIFSAHQLNVPQLIIAEIAHLIAGFVLGLIPFAFYLWAGPKHSLLKGMGIGAGLWLNHAVFIPSLVDGRVHLIPTIMSLIVELIAIIVWGIVSFGFIVKCCDRDTRLTE